MINKTKAFATSAAVALIGVLALFFNNMGSVADYQKACLAAPKCEKILNAILQARLSDGTNALLPSELIQLSANRFGYGLSSIEPNFQPDHAEAFTPYQIAYILYAQLEGIDPTLVSGNFVAPDGQMDPLLSEGYVADYRRQFKRLSLTRGYPCFDSNNLMDNGLYRLGSISTIDAVRLLTELRKRRPQCDRDLDNDGINENLTGLDANNVRRAIRTVAIEMDLFRGVFGSQYIYDGKVYDIQMNFQQVLHEFWFNRFNIDYSKSDTLALGDKSYSKVIRSNQNSTLRQLLGAIIKTPAMLEYLDNNRNIFDSSGVGNASNQNLGRELLELHSFGVGPVTPQDESPYNQTDVEVASMVLTGHTYDADVNSVTKNFDFGYRFNAANSYPVTFKLRKRYWDSLPDAQRPLFFTPGRLDVLDAQTPATRLERLLDMVANHPYTVRSVCKTLARRFTRAESELAVRTNCIAALGAGGNLKAAYMAVLSSPEIWSRVNARPQISNPLEIVTQNVRATGIRWNAIYKTTDLGASADRAHALGQFMRDAVKTMGLEYKVVGPPTGYDMNGIAWLSQGYVMNATRLAFFYAHLDRHTGIQIQERKFTESSAVRESLMSLPSIPQPEVQETVESLLYSPVRKAASTTIIRNEQALDIRDLMGQTSSGNFDFVPDQYGNLIPSDVDTVHSLGKLNRLYFMR